MARTKLRIAQIAPLWFPVPPRRYGGIERVMGLLVDELVARGHHVTLFAAPGSRTRAQRTVSVADRPLAEAGYAWSDVSWNLYSLSRAFRLAAKGAFDIVHSHVDDLALHFQAFSSVPVLHTMHGNLLVDGSYGREDRIRLFAHEASRTNMAFISAAARRTSRVSFARAWVVHNAVDLSHFRFHPRGGDAFLWIGRFDPEKGPEEAIRAAERSGERLLLAGRIDPMRREYFERRIRPRLSRRIEYLGELSQEQLPDFYGAGKALLFPLSWEEPFGLVAAEAMACGTPVIAWPYGSMPELIDHGISGFVTRPTMEAFAEAMGRVEHLDRRRVRAHAEVCFSPSRMAQRYEEVYQELLEASLTNRGFSDIVSPCALSRFRPNGPF